MTFSHMEFRTVVINTLYLMVYIPHHHKALNSLICADVSLRNYSLTHSWWSGIVVGRCSRSTKLSYIRPG